MVNNLLLNKQDMHMETIRISDILKLDKSGFELAVNGWVRTRRDAKGFCFLEVNDGSCLANLQVIAPETLPEYDTLIQKITTGSSVSVKGVLVDSPAQGQKFELHALSLDVPGLAPQDFPLQKKKHSLEFLREIAHLRPRTNSIGAVARVRSSLSYAVHTFFQERGFFYVHTPIITASDCEGAGEMFHVSTLDPEKLPRTPDGKVDYSKDFFGKPASLTVSGQLEGEIYAMALGKIYTFGPTFRAENSNTPRHLAEFWMIEPEVAFYRLADDMNLAEEFVRYLAKHALDKNLADLEFFNERIDNGVIDRVKNIAESPFERICYTDAITILEKNNDKFEYKVKWGSDIQSEHDR
jgi:asparaginyl-tRNA synthetase